MSECELCEIGKAMHKVLCKFVNVVCSENHFEWLLRLDKS